MKLIKWVQFKGPVSILSISLPDIFSLARHTHNHGWKCLLVRRPPPRSRSEIFPNEADGFGELEDGNGDEVAHSNNSYLPARPPTTVAAHSSRDEEMPYAYYGIGAGVTTSEASSNGHDSTDST